MAGLSLPLVFLFMNTAELSLAFTGVVLQAILLVALLWRKQNRKFPWFFGYLAAGFLRDIVLFSLQQNPKPYFYVYWMGDTVVTILICLALYETFRIVFQYFLKLTWVRLVLPFTGIALILIGLARMVSGSGSTESKVLSLIFSLEIVADILQVGIFFLFLVLVQFFRLPWKQYTFGIAVGFGVSAAGSLVAFMVRSEFGTKFDPIFRFVVPLTYTIGVVIWLLTFLWKVPEAQLKASTPALTPEAVVTELRQYTRTVKEILKR